MNLAQYRLKAANQNRNRLWLCLAVAGILHTGAIALTHPLSRHPSPKPSDPIQFIAIDPLDSLPAFSTIHAPVNSAARRSQATPPVVSTFSGITSRSPLPTPPAKPPPQVVSTFKPATVKDQIWGTYLATLRQRIYQQWQTTLRGKGDRPPKVRFAIDRQGHLTDLELLQSSSQATADQAALEAVQTAAPFAPLPNASKEDRLRITFTFEEAAAFPQ
jgi:TonB family protein